MSTKNPIPPCPFLDSEKGMEFYYSENMTCDSCSNSDEHRAFLEGWHRGWNASKVKMVEELLLALQTDHGNDCDCRAHVLIDCIREGDKDPLVSVGRALDRLYPSDVDDDTE